MPVTRPIWYSPGLKLRVANVRWKYVRSETLIGPVAFKALQTRSPLTSMTPRLATELVGGGYAGQHLMAGFGRTGFHFRQLGNDDQQLVNLLDLALLVHRRQSGQTERAVCCLGDAGAPLVDGQDKNDAQERYQRQKHQRPSDGRAAC